MHLRAEHFTAPLSALSLAELMTLCCLPALLIIASSFNYHKLGFVFSSNRKNNVPTTGHRVENLLFFVQISEGVRSFIAHHNKVCQFVTVTVVESLFQK